MHSVVPFSALRDPVDSKVRVFFDAEPWLHGNTEECHFARAGHEPQKYYDENAVEDTRQEVEVCIKPVSNDTGGSLLRSQHPDHILVLSYRIESMI